MAKRTMLNLTGRVFGKLTVLTEAPCRVTISPGHPPQRKRYWHCQCDCGNAAIIPQVSLLRSVIPTRSCGCWGKERRRKASTTHGRHRTRIYRIWSNMRSRCENNSIPAFSRYGGRGIKVCDRWFTFQNFLDDMGEPPTSKHSIERRNNDGDYEPSNCRWATPTEQNNNKRSNHLLTHQGLTMSIAQWGQHLGFSRSTIPHRLDRGWSVERALTIPQRIFARK